jgi:Arc/MetJ-type ribon-helix-helix transcriptional regulator
MMEKKDVRIPAGLYGKIEERIKGSEFSSVGDYVVFVLTELLAAEETQKQGGRLSDEEEKQVKARLKSLGYLD